ncbi:MAG: hypothetical protein IPP41_15375 [Rhodocyclaceae bacterium]|nr:hypothetical protein [Rhodocyclaceae bacterium]
MNAFEQFKVQYPEYALTSALDELRASEYHRLDTQDQVYLDYTGAGLHAASQIRQHADLLSEQILGNPHSPTPSSTEATRGVEQAPTRCSNISMRLVNTPRSLPRTLRRR